MKRIIIFSLFLLLPIAELSAQQTANIVGLVQDATGAAIPDATVTLTNTSTDSKRVVKTNGEGEYDASSLAIGTYKVEVVKEGFQTLDRSGVVLTTASTLTVNLTLSVGSQSQTVTVTGAAPLLQSQTGQVSNLVDSKQMVSLPLATRNFTDLVLLTPGAHTGSAANLSEGHGLYSIRGGDNFSVNGSLAAGNSYLIDGLYDRNQWLNTLVMVPIVDSIDEYRVLTSNYDAEYGNAAGAVTTVSTKSGTNSIHGAAWEFLRNDLLNANYFFSNRNGIPRAPYHRNVFGGDIGGPILHNRLFFFGDYQGIRQSEPTVATSTIPTPAEVAMVETGDFSGLGMQLYNPYSGTSKARLPFANNDLSAYLDPAAVKLISLLPAPTAPGATNNYTIDPSGTLTDNQFDVRLDANVGAADHLFFKYSFDKPDQLVPGTIYPKAGASIQVGQFLTAATNQNIDQVQTQSGTLGYTHVFSPTLLLDAHAGILRWYANSEVFGQQYASATAIGIPGINYDSLRGGLPAASITGFAGLGDASSAPEDSRTTTFQYDAEITKVAGTHTVKTGISFLRDRFNAFTSFPARGTFGFNGQFTSQIGHPNSLAALADFAIGAEDTGSRKILKDEVGMRDYHLGGYVQDSWRATSRLTVEYGARYDIDTPPYEVHNHWANLDLRTGLLRVAGIGGNRRRLRNIDFNTFQPRLGWAYTIGKDRRTVVRSGFGISYLDMQNGTQLFENLPYFFNQTIATTSTAAPPTTLSAGFPTPVQLDPNDIAAISVGSPIAWNVNNPQSRIIQYSLGVQHSFRGNVLAELSYVGTRGEHLMNNNFNINQSFPGPGPQGPRYPYYTINPNLVQVDYTTDDGDSYYNSLQAHVEKRLSNGINFGVSYTYSSYLADTGDPNGGGNHQIQDARCLRCNLGPTPDSHIHTLVINHVFELPFGTGRRFLNHGLVSYLVGPWNFSGIWTLYSGDRFTATYSSNVSNSSGGGKQRPNRIASGKLAHGQSIDHWFDTSAFVAPAQYTFGNSGTGILTGPGYFNADLTLERLIRIRERYSLDLRGEAFNVFNRANFDDPNAVIGNKQAGIISGTSDPRVMQVALKLIF